MKSPIQTSTFQTFSTRPVMAFSCGLQRREHMAGAACGGFWTDFFAIRLKKTHAQSFWLQLTFVFYFCVFLKALFTPGVFLGKGNLGMGGNMVITKSPQILSPHNTLVYGRVFNLVKNEVVGGVFAGIIPSKTGEVNGLLGIFWDLENTL